jgi:tellurite resistance protein TerC
VEISDLIFAVDSIPAIFAVTTDPFIVYTSNVFAILGLRSLYFALAGVMDKFHYLKTGLGVVLAFVGVKMMLGHTEWKIDTHLSLGVIIVVLTASVVASIIWPKRVKSPGLESPGHA